MTKQKFALGSVQFGMKYGVGSQLKSLAVSEVEGILKTASELKIDLIDTASLYGGSEERLAQSAYTSDFSYVTKTIKSDAEVITESYLEDFNTQLERSLRLLKSTYGVLFHRPSDVFKKGGDALFKRLTDLKKEGKIQKIGFSIYDPTELVQLKEHFDFDLVQLPCSIFDQRASESEVVRTLFKKGVEFHSRSSFLKGAIFLTQENIPPKLNPELKRLEAFASTTNELKVSPIELAFSYLKKQDFISRIVIGVQSEEQLRQTIGLYNSSKVGEIDYLPFAFQNHDLLNPGNW
ncbi:MAG: aldo/keto reductase [Bdellovibrionota bacterium]|nr:aldo/keto reductase [Bdellovibrionota bacterium]